MSENAETHNESVVEADKGYSSDLGERMIAVLGGLIMFGFVYGVMAALVAIVRVSEAPGWTIQQFMDVIKLVPPEGVSLSGLPAISFPPPAPQRGILNLYFLYEIVLLNIAWLVGLFGGWWGYKKVLDLPDSE
jgi:hypothetical protein